MKNLSSLFILFFFLFSSQVFARYNGGNHGKSAGTPTFDTVMTAQTNVCAIDKVSDLYCWGDNGAGQLGLGDQIRRTTPQFVMSNVVSVSTATWGTCAIKEDRSLWCWGWNGDGQVGNGGNGTLVKSPVQVIASTTPIKNVSVGGQHACALAYSGTLYCWGYNLYGQLGNGGTISLNVPTAVGAPSYNFSTLSLGYFNSCAITSGGQLYCWGKNSDGQLGLGDYATRYVPTLVSSLSNVASISSHYWGSCVIRRPGGLYCWGKNSWGIVGQGSETELNYPSPMFVDPFLGFSPVDVQIYSSSNCVRRSDGQIFCWGHGYHGQLGYSDLNNHITAPVQVQGLPGPVALLVPGGMGGRANAHCAMEAGGKNLWCWGDNSFGEFGNGTEQLVDLPPTQSNVINIDPERTISAMRQATCAMDAGLARCWGDNTYGQLGDGTNTSSTAPVKVQTLVDAVATATGGYHACAVQQSGNVSCWGYNVSGQLGNGTTTNSNTPVLVNGLGHHFSKIAAGNLYTCALDSEAGGQVFCWGNNTYGQLGNNSTTSSSTPVQVLSSVGIPLTGVVQIASGGNTVCALLANGTVRCWGRGNFGQMGNGTVNANNLMATFVNMPSVSSFGDAMGISVGWTHACMMMARGAMFCWGYNSNGQIGIAPTTTYSSTPVQVANIASAHMMALGDNHSCVARIASGAPQLICFGANSFGQLGTGEYADISVPPAAAGSPPVWRPHFMGAGGNQSFGAPVTLSGGYLRAWGDNASGQLGLGTSGTTEPFAKTVLDYPVL